jgi:hypothetical protein
MLLQSQREGCNRAVQCASAARNALVAAQGALAAAQRAEKSAIAAETASPVEQSISPEFFHTYVSKLRPSSRMDWFGRLVSGNQSAGVP